MQARYNRAGRKFVLKKINVQSLIRPCRLEFLVKINNRAARLFGSLEYVLGYLEHNSGRIFLLAKEAELGSAQVVAVQWPARAELYAHITSTHSRLHLYIRLLELKCL